MKTIWLFLIVALLVSSVCLSAVYVCYHIETDPSDEDFFFGVSFGGNTASEAKLLIDRVKGYTNLFVINSWDISTNETALNEICEYAVNANLNIIVYFRFIFINSTRSSELFRAAGIDPFHVPWLNSTMERWRNKFLGVYLYDEPGGKQIDVGYYTGNTMNRLGRPFTTFENVSDYSDAANRYVRVVSRSGGGMQLLINSSNYNLTKIPLFTADYALYWFNYLAGYDAIFAELGWNHSETQHMALCRGAANVQNKQWGAIITWTYNDPPYLASGPKIFQDMLTAYRAGAKYVIVFNYPKYPETNPYGILSEEHFVAIKRFWTFTHAYPRDRFGKVEGQVAFVLPKDYGWGMRNPDDKIWGFWPPDYLSPMIWDKMIKLEKRYGLKLDIIYDDPEFDFEEKYSKIHFWNSTID